jgi:3,4-dihydroxy 2-butanone 4-phosphate synthase/GTP cyclohydrolase II
VEANERPFKADQRDYGMGVQILREIGVRSMRLLSNNPRKLVAIGLWPVGERVAAAGDPSVIRRTYLKTKKRSSHKLFRLRIRVWDSIRWFPIQVQCLVFHGF